MDQSDGCLTRKPPVVPSQSPVENSFHAFLFMTVDIVTYCILYLGMSITESRIESNPNFK